MSRHFRLVFVVRYCSRCDIARVGTVIGREDDEDEDDLNLTNLTVVQKTRC